MKTLTLIARRRGLAYGLFRAGVRHWDKAQQVAAMEDGWIVLMPRPGCSLATARKAVKAANRGDCRLWDWLCYERECWSYNKTREWMGWLPTPVN